MVSKKVPVQAGYQRKGLDLQAPWCRDSAFVFHWHAEIPFFHIMVLCASRDTSGSGQMGTHWLQSLLAEAALELKS